MNTLDAVVLGTLLLGGLLGFVTGFVRGGLFVASWIGAVFATLYGFRHAQPHARAHVAPDWAADIVAGAAIFLVSLIALHVVSHMIAGQIRHSALNALDRSLGLLAGAATTAAALCIAFLAASDLVPVDEQPEWARSARATPLLAQGALVLRQLAPPELQARTGRTLEEGLQALGTLDATLPAVEQLVRPPDAGAPAPAAEYGADARQRLEDAIEGAIGDAGGDAGDSGSDDAR